MVITGSALFGANASTSALTIASNASTTAPSLLTISGNYTNNNGVFNHAGGTVYIAGTASGQTLSGFMVGSSTFNNLTILNNNGTHPDTDPAVIFGNSASTTGIFTAAVGSTTLRFLASATSTFQNLTLNGGAATSPVFLRSSVSGTRWNLDVPGTQSISYVNVKDSDACNSDPNIDASNGTNVDSGNNRCWNFSSNAATIAAAANQTFQYHQAATAISTLTVTAGSGTGAITSTNGLRVAIATSTVNMLWDTTATTATFGGTGSGNVSNPVSYEGGGSVLSVPVGTTFTSGQTLTISGLNFTSFNSVVASSTALKLFLDGPSDQSANATDTAHSVAIYGTLTLGDYTLGQTTNKLDIGGDTTLTNAELFRFMLTPVAENASTTVTLSLSAVRGFVSSDFTNTNLYVDANSNGTVDAGDYTVGGNGSVSIAGNTGTIIFTTPWATTTQTYILRTNVSDDNAGNTVTIGLTTSNITASGTVSKINITPSGSAASITHWKASAGGGSVGGSAPADIGTFGGTGRGGGTPAGGGESGGGSTGGGGGSGGGAGGGIDFVAPLLKMFATLPPYLFVSVVWF